MASKGDIVQYVILSHLMPSISSDAASWPSCPQHCKDGLGKDPSEHTTLLPLPLFGAPADASDANVRAAGACRASSLTCVRAAARLDSTLSMV